MEEGAEILPAEVVVEVTTVEEMVGVVVMEVEEEVGEVMVALERDFQLDDRVQDLIRDRSSPGPTSKMTGREGIEIF